MKDKVWNHVPQILTGSTYMRGENNLILSPKDPWSQHDALQQTRWPAVCWILFCYITDGFEGLSPFFLVLLAVSATAVGNVADIFWESNFVSVVISSTPARTLKKPGSSSSFGVANKCELSGYRFCLVHFFFFYLHPCTCALFAPCTTLFYAIVHLLSVITNVSLI